MRCNQTQMRWASRADWCVVSTVLSTEIVDIYYRREIIFGKGYQNRGCMNKSAGPETGCVMRMISSASALLALGFMKKPPHLVVLF